MKKIFFLFIIALAATVACTKKDLLEVAYINAAEGSTFTPAEVSALGDEVTISFSTNYQWQIRGWSTLGFCSLDATKGEAGNGTITVKVEPNATDEVRTAEFDILAGAAVQTVTITQTETNAIDIGTTSYNAPADGGIVEIAVSANIEYTVNIPSEITWIREATRSKAMVNSYVNLEVDPNSGWLGRSASGITVTGKDIEGNDITIPITVSQEANPDYVSVLWTKTFKTDWTSIAATIPTHIAMYDGSLYVANASEVHSVGADDGSYGARVTVNGLTVAPQSMANDDAGNLIFAANASCASEDFVVYSYDGSTVTELARYGAGNLYTGTLGNLRVIGDISGKAVVTAVASGVNYFVAWQIEGGKVTSTVAKPTPYTSPYGISDVVYGVVSPVSDDLADGLVFIGYAGSPYVLYYNDDPANATKENWTATYDTGTGGNENFNSISIAEYKGKRYCAIGQDGHFSWSSAPKAILLDISDFSNVTLAYEGSFTGTFGFVGANDVKLVPDEDALKFYLVNAGYDFATCIALK